MSLSNSPSLLDFHNIRVMRGQKIALDDFTLRIGADEHVAILGPNGCGKSTLIKTITRECYPVARPESSMSICGQEMWDVFKLRAGLGIVSNDLMLSCTGDSCGRDVVLSGFFGSTAIYPNHTVDPQQAALADAALAELKISYLSDRPVCEMSSGEARRVLIARALVHKPRALLFDEPCNSLDLSAQQSVRHTMSALAKAGNGDHSGDARTGRYCSGDSAGRADEPRTDHGGRSERRNSPGGTVGGVVRRQCSDGAAGRALPLVVNRKPIPSQIN